MELPLAPLQQAESVSWPCTTALTNIAPIRILRPGHGEARSPWRSSLGVELVREAVDRGVPLQQVDPKANVISDLKRIILPEEAVAAPKKSRSLYDIGRGLLRRSA